MKTLTISELRRGKGPIWVLNGTRASASTNYSLGEVVIEIRDSSARTLRNLNDWLKGTTGAQRQQVVAELGTWMQQRTSERGAEFVSGKTRPIDTPMELVAAVENNERVTEVRHMVLPSTWLPMCVTNEFKRKVLLGNSDFVKAIKEGQLLPISEEDAQAILAKEGADKELERLDRQREARQAVDSVQLVMDPVRMSGYPQVTVGTPRPLTEAPVEIRGNDTQGFLKAYGPDVTQIARPLTTPGDEVVAPKPVEPSVQRKWWHVLLFWR